MVGTLLLALVLCLTAAAQDNGLAPDTLLLSRIKSHMAEQLKHLPNFTCLETVARFRALREKPPKAQDVLQLEVVYSDGNEWYAYPGDRAFTATHPSRFAAGGLTGTGSFALVLHNIFVADGAVETWRGEETRNGRNVVRWDYRFALTLKPHSITVPEGSAIVGESGSFWADPETLEVVALEAHAEDIPPYLSLAEDTTRIAFGRIRIGEREALLPQQSDIQLVRANGELHFDHADFTHCRAYQAESVLHFGTFSDSELESPVRPPQTLTEVVPPFLPVIVQLETPITEKDAVGTLIRGRVVAGVAHKGRTVLPRGSVVRGRIRRLERYDDNTWALGLEFTEVDVNGAPLRFYAELTALDPSKTVRRRVSEKLIVVTARRTAVVTLPMLYGVASFFVTGKSFTLPAGFKTVWQTRGLLRQ
jgi:hypothetical protein